MKRLIRLIFTLTQLQFTNPFTKHNRIHKCILKCVCYNHVIIVDSDNEAMELPARDGGEGEGKGGVSIANKFSCTWGNGCVYSTCVKNSLTAHMRAHTGAKPYKCDQCDYANNQKGNLTTHVRTHTAIIQ